MLTVGDVAVGQLIDRGPGRGGGRRGLGADPLTHSGVGPGADQDVPVGPRPLGPAGHLLGVGGGHRAAGRGPDPGGRQPQHGREQGGLDEGADLRAQPGDLLGDGGGPVGLQVPGAHRGQGARQQRAHGAGGVIGPLRGPRRDVQHRGQVGVHELVLVRRPRIPPAGVDRLPSGAVGGDLLTGPPGPGLDPQQLDRADRVDHPLGRRHDRLGGLHVRAQQILLAEREQRGGERGDVRACHLTHRHLEHVFDSTGCQGGKEEASTSPRPPDAGPQTSPG